MCVCVCVCSSKNKRRRRRRGIEKNRSLMRCVCVREWRWWVGGPTTCLFCPGERGVGWERRKDGGLICYVSLLRLTARIKMHVSTHTPKASLCELRIKKRMATLVNFCVEILSCFLELCCVLNCYCNCNLLPVVWVQ